MLEVCNLFTNVTFLEPNLSTECIRNPDYCQSSEESGKTHSINIAGYTLWLNNLLVLNSVYLHLFFLVMYITVHAVCLTYLQQVTQTTESSHVESTEESSAPVEVDTDKAEAAEEKKGEPEVIQEEAKVEPEKVVEVPEELPSKKVQQREEQTEAPAEEKPYATETQVKEEPQREEPASESQKEENQEESKIENKEQVEQKTEDIVENEQEMEDVVEEVKKQDCHPGYTKSSTDLTHTGVSCLCFALAL